MDFIFNICKRCKQATDAAVFTTRRLQSSDASRALSAWRCSVEHLAVLGHPSPDAGVLMLNNVDQLPVTEADVDFRRRRPPLTAPRFFFQLYSDWTNLLAGSQSLYPYHDEPFNVLCEYSTASVVVLISTFTGSLLQKPPVSAMLYADWFQHSNVTHTYPTV